MHCMHFEIEKLCYWHKIEERGWFEHVSINTITDCTSISVIWTLSLFSHGSLLFSNWERSTWFGFPLLADAEKSLFQIHCYFMHLLKTILIRSWLLGYSVDGHSWVNSCPLKVDARQLFSTAPEENLNHITCFFIVGVWRCAILLCMAIMNMIWIRFDCDAPLGPHRHHFIYIA